MKQKTRKISSSLQAVGGVKVLKLLPRKDRAFLLAKICSEKEKPLSARAAAKAQADSLMQEGELLRAAEIYKENGFLKQMKEAALKQIESKIWDGGIRIRGPPESERTKIIARRYGVSEDQVKEIARSAIEARMSE